jgi:hypothetical protein
MTPALELGDVGQGWGQGRIGNVVVIVYQSATPNAAVDLSLERIDRAIAKHPAGIALLAIFSQNAPAPSSEARRRISQHLARSAGKLLIGATVIEGTNMRAMATRAATAMMTTILRPPYLHKVLDTAAAACSFVEPKAVDDALASMTAGDILSGVISLRAAIPSAQ